MVKALLGKAKPTGEHLHQTPPMLVKLLLAAPEGQVFSDSSEGFFFSRH